MKDIMQKLAELEATAPKATKKKVLTEDSGTTPVTGKKSLKDVFSELHESVPVGAKPLPVLDPTNKQAGMGFVTSTNPSVQNMLKNLDPKDVQIVQAPGQQTATAAGKPAPAGSTVQPQVGQQVQEQDEDEDMDEGFFVCIGDEEDGGFVGMLTKEGGRWREVAISGTTPYKWGTGYMSYLSSDDIMQHIRNDFRHSDVAGPFSDEQDAIEYASRQYGLGQNQLDELSPELLNRAGEKARSQSDQFLSRAKEYAHGSERTGLPNLTAAGYQGAGHLAKANQANKFMGASERAREREQNRASYSDLDNHMSPAMKRKLGLEEDQLDELSSKTLKSYLKKSEPDRDYNSQRSKQGAYDPNLISPKKDAFHGNELRKRRAGIDMAYNKLTDRLASFKNKEEQLDELSPKTLQSYAKKADVDFHQTNNELKKRYHNGLDPDLMRQSNSRRQGMKLAGDKVMGRAKVPATGVSSRVPATEDRLDELSPNTLKSYKDKASSDYDKHTSAYDKGIRSQSNRYNLSKSTKDHARKSDNRENGINLANKKLAATNEGAKVDRMVKHVEKSERDLGKSKEKASDIAWATANKRGMLDNKNKKVKEADIPSTRGLDTMGAGLGAGRSATTLESNSISAAAKKSESQRQSLIKKAARELNFKTKPTTAEKLVKKYDLFASDAAAITKIAKELSKVQEGKKPDFLDLDKDGNKKESMKKAAAAKKKTVSENNKDIPYDDPEMVKHRAIQNYLDKEQIAKNKKKKKVDESMNHRISAARFEGKSHGLKGHAHCGKAYEDLEEMKAYCEGYKDGLDECYGQGVYETAPAMPPATLGGMASQAMPTTMPAMEDEFGEGNAFTAALAKTPKGGKFSLGGRSYTDRSSIDEYAFESWDRQLDSLLNEDNSERPYVCVHVKKGKCEVKANSSYAAAKKAADKWGLKSTSGISAHLADVTHTAVNEGLSVSISKGQQNSPDSVTITAQDQEAEHLLAFVKNAGLGLFGDDNADTHSSAMSVPSNDGAPGEVGAGSMDIDVVDGHDGMLGLMQKLSGIAPSGSEDYADEEDSESQEYLYGNNEDEESCIECGGMMEQNHSCGSKEMVEDDEDHDEWYDKDGNVDQNGAHDAAGHYHRDRDQVDEVESEDQMTDEMAEDNAPDTGEAESTADEDAEAKEDAALAGEKEEEMNESFVSMLARLDRLSESKDDEDEDEDDDDDDDDGSHKFLGAAGKAKKSFGKEVEESRYPWLDHPDRPGAKKKKDDDKDKSSSNKKKVDEWANQAGKGPGKGTDASFEQDIEFMTKVIAGGLNKPKSTGQTTVPVIAGQEDRMHDNPNDWATLAGIKK